MRPAYCALPPENSPCVCSCFVLYSHRPCSPRGALMRRRDGGAGRRRDRRTGPQSGGRAPGKSGPSIGAAPGWFGSQPAHGRRRGSARGRYPPARSWLTEAARQLRVWRRCLARKADLKPDHESPERPRKARPDAVRKNAAAERREARRWAIPPASQAILRQARPRGGPRVRRSAPAPVGALLPSFFKGAEEGQRATGALP